MFFQSFNKKIVIMDTLAASNNLTVSLWSKHIERECQIGTLGVRLHIKRLNGGRVVVNHDRTVELIRNAGFLVPAEVVAKFGGIALLLQDTNGFFVGNAREGWFDVFELLDVA